MPLVNEESNTAKLPLVLWWAPPHQVMGFHKPVIMYYSSVSQVQGANAVK